MELNWFERLRDRNKKKNCRKLLKSSTQLRKAGQFAPWKERERLGNNALAKRAKVLFFIVKYANLRHSGRPPRRGCLSILKTTANSRRFCNLKFIHMVVLIHNFHVSELFE